MGRHQSIPMRHVDSQPLDFVVRATTGRAERRRGTRTEVRDGETTEVIDRSANALVVERDATDRRKGGIGS